jgi:hypothetical protein
MPDCRWPSAGHSAACLQAGRQPQRAANCNSATRRRCRFTSIFPGACRSAPTAISTRMRCRLAGNARSAAAIPEDDYLAALIADLEVGTAAGLGPPGDSVFFGGGTPSLLSGEAVDRLLTALRSRLPLLPRPKSRWKPIREPSRPENLPPFAPPASTACRLASRASTRATSRRSAASTTIAKPGRRSNCRQPLRQLQSRPDVRSARADACEALDDIDAALAFAPPHLSCYQLTIEANTAFAAQPPTLPEADSCADMQDAIEARLAEAGYTHYETSAFAQRASSAGTTSTTGISATTWASAPAPTAS